MNRLMRPMADPPKKRTEKRVCPNCNIEFEALIYILKDREIDYNRLCPVCEKEKQNQEEIAAYNEQLEQTRTERRAKWTETCGITGTLKEKTFDNFNSRIQAQAYQAVKNYKDRSLVLISPQIYGVGKTHLVAALANHLITTRDPAAFEKGSYRILTSHCPVYFTEETLLLARIRDTYNDKAAETEEMVYRQLAAFPLLIIDDVGKVRPRDMSFTQSVYFRIINQRYIDKKPIILTTNLDVGNGKLSDHIGPACADRLFEMCGAQGFIHFKGSSYRKKVGSAETKF